MLLRKPRWTNEKADEVATIGADKNKARGAGWKGGEVQDERGKRIAELFHWYGGGGWRTTSQYLRKKKSGS